MVLKEEFPGANDVPSSSSPSPSPSMLSFSMANNNARTMNSPRPKEGHNESGPPPFLTKSYEIIEESRTNNIVSCSQSKNSFIVWDPQIFSSTLLPRHFKRSNFSSFVRQLISLSIPIQSKNAEIVRLRDL